jgi:hypothetical protein
LDGSSEEKGLLEVIAINGRVILKCILKMELYTLYKDSDIVTYIKVNRLRWAGHVIRLE